MNGKSRRHWWRGGGQGSSGLSDSWTPDVGRRFLADDSTARDKERVQCQLLFLTTRVAYCGVIGTFKTIVPVANTLGIILRRPRRHGPSPLSTHFC